MAELEPGVKGITEPGRDETQGLVKILGTFLLTQPVRPSRVICGGLRATQCSDITTLCSETPAY